ncbi:MAG TPA: hypothetical protein PK883_00085 [Anaerolineaceae bacterium]|nr:hypothetical protein [Anaerolineaceae bacterium]
MDHQQPAPLYYHGPYRVTHEAMLATSLTLPADEGNVERVWTN